MQCFDVFLPEISYVRVEEVLLLSTWEWRVDESGISRELCEG
jgi:hypothetical protein